MRLINTRTLEVVSKRDDEIPPYAILSHTWGRDEEEVTLEDMQALFAAAKTDPTALSTHPIVYRMGFIKIRDFAKLALSEKRDYIWVDTCCIDKTSSAELSEAINSMFRWYQEAEICYVFLSDVDDSSPQAPPMDDVIIRSRWFTRGWTLQELIAPAVVRFYSKNWHLLGTKGPASESFASSLYLSQREPADSCAGAAAFLSTLQRATGIDKNLLDGSLGLEEFGVATRMKWASRRQTTRLEDKAYCLMGLFGVNMPLLYGEGMKAFIRLQEAILLTTDDQSIFAWKCPHDNSQDKLSGLLSKTPAWFEDSGHAKPLPSNALTNSTPLSITSAGLRVTMALFKLSDVALPQQQRSLPVSEHVFAAVLDCSPYRSADAKEHMLYKPAVILLWLGGDQYARFDPAALLDIHAIGETQHVNIAAYKDIYVKQNPAVLSLPEIYLEDQKLLMASHTKYSLVDVWYPRGQWDESTRTIRCKTANAGILCRFRYVIRRRHIDVFVGMHDSVLSYRTGPVRLWCHVQRAGIDEELSVQIEKLSKRTVLASEHRCMGVHARISVGSEKHAKHGNATLELRPFYISHELKSLDATTQKTVVHETMTTGAESAQAQDQETRHAIFQLLCCLVVNDKDSFCDFFAAVIPRLSGDLLARTCLYPIRSTQNTLVALDDNTVFTPDRNYSKSFDRPVREMMEGIELDLENAEIAGEVSSSVSGSEDRFLRHLQSKTKNYEIEDWRAFMSHRTKRPVPQPARWGQKGQQSTAHSRGRFYDVWLPAHTWRYPKGLEFLELNIMHYAAALNFAEALKYLITQDSSTGARFFKAEGFLTPLHLACLLGHNQAVDALLRDSEVQWAEVLSKTSHFDHPLSMAVSFVRDQRATQLVASFKRFILVAQPDCGSDWISYTQNTLGETSLHRAAAMNNPTSVDAIISHFSEGSRDNLDRVDKQGRTPLWHAAAAGSYRALALLLDRGAEPNSQDFHGVTVLHAACRAPFDPAKLVEALLSRGADPNVYIAVDSPLRNTPSILVTPCFYAAMHDGSATLQALLKFGASPGMYPAQGSISPLHIAAANGYLECVDVLCRAGFDMDAVTPYRLHVDVDKNVKVVEAKAQGSLDGSLKEQEERQKDARRQGFSGVLRRFNQFEKRETDDGSSVEDRASVVSYRDVASKIQKVTLEAFPLGELRTSLELAGAGGHQDVVAVLEQFTGQS